MKENNHLIFYLLGNSKRFWNDVILINTTKFHIHASVK